MGVHVHIIYAKNLYGDGMYTCIQNTSSTHDQRVNQISVKHIPRAHIVISIDLFLYSWL